MSGSSKGPQKRSGKKKRAIPSRKESYREGAPSEVVLPHKHCFNCGISIPPGKDICSDKCQLEWDRMMKRKKMLTYLPIFGILFLIVLYMIIVYG